MWLDFAMWWSAEMINMITFLPVVLALPNKEIFQRYWHDQRRITWDWMTVFPFLGVIVSLFFETYRDWETDRKSTRLNSSHITRSRMPSSA